MSATQAIRRVFDWKVRGVRWIEIIGLALVAAMIFSVYLAKAAAANESAEIASLERQIARSNAAIANERETIGLLNAEWSSLVRPERLQRLSEQHLTLRRISPDQFVKVDELAARIPAEPPVKLEEQGKDAIGDILKAME
jgi:hypothetical protein